MSHRGILSKNHRLSLNEVVLPENKTRLWKRTVFKFQDIGSRDEWLQELESACKEAITFKERLEVTVP